MTDDLKARKIMPLNQTARSEALVRGNPVTTRPDSAVENTFPGLEFDHRNLEKQFLNGLLFELHAASGGWLRDFDRTRGFPISETDFEAGLMIWGVVGILPTDDNPQVTQLTPLLTVGFSGNQIWQIIREFEPGPAVVILGPHRGPNRQPTSEQLEQILDALRSGQTTSIPVAGEPSIVVIFGERSAYLNDGVIDTNLFEPGDLTRSLCSPWQYDFTDCGCWYWASNKPDMVSVTPDGPQIYNFQRVRTEEIAPEPPRHPPVVEQGLWRQGHGADTTVPEGERVPRQMNHAELINGWEILPVVINDGETDRFTGSPIESLPDDELFPEIATIVDRLQYLAGIEHALMIEYLYAYYSIDAPRRRPAQDEVEALRLYEAANTILGVAIDEMRHFRWVNEILVHLGAAPVVRRAVETEDKDGNGRFIEHTFALTAATRQQIDWFIQVEQSSQAVDPDVQADTIDGMYTRLLLSIERSTDIEPDIKERVGHLIKLIIDEGYDHYHRFQRVRQLLPEDQSYLRISSNPQPLGNTDAAKGLEERVNRSYEVILNLLLVVFGRGDAEHGQLLEATRIAMVDSLDVETLNLIAGGGAPLFAAPVLTNDLNLGVFTANPPPQSEIGPVIAHSINSAADPVTIISSATAPLDALNAAELNAPDADRRRRAQRSSEVLARVRSAFVAALQSNGS